MVLGSQSFLSLSTAFSPLLQWSRSVTKEGRADMLGTDESSEMQWNGKGESCHEEAHTPELQSHPWGFPGAECFYLLSAPWFSLPSFRGERVGQAMLWYALLPSSPFPPTKAWSRWQTQCNQLFGGFSFFTALLGRKVCCWFRSGSQHQEKQGALMGVPYICPCRQQGTCILPSRGC